MAKSKVFMFNREDPEMQQASVKARENFKYFWRELSWEYRRIVPGLDLACVKAPFSDGDDDLEKLADEPSVEHMWINEINFDGRVVSGVLLNNPNWLKSVKAGGAVKIPLDEIADWMYAISGEVYGAYTVQLMRSRMSPQEMAGHDNAWGLKFGNPANVRLIPEPKRGGLKALLGKQTPQYTLDGDHPMSISMGPELKKAIAKDPSFLTSVDEGV